MRLVSMSKLDILIMKLLLCVLLVIFSCSKKSEIGIKRTTYYSKLVREKDSLELLTYTILMKNNSNYEDILLNFESNDSTKNNYFFESIYNYNFDFFRINGLDKYFSLSTCDNFESRHYNKIISWYHRRVYKYQKTNDFNKLFFALAVRYLFTHIQRNSLSIINNFQKYKNIFYNKVNKKKYNSLEIGVTIERLLYTHNKYLSFKYDKVYDSIFSINKILDYPENMIHPHSRANNWYYSFWYRRYLEGNREVTYKILREIQEHYK